MGNVVWKRPQRRATNTTWFLTLGSGGTFGNEIYEFDFQDIGELHEGVSYHVEGYILQDCENITINLMNREDQDIALHVSARLPQNYVIRSCRIEKIWDKAEVTSPLPFVLRRGEYFSVEILVTRECYMISINGHHYAEYKHRLSYGSVDVIEVKGDVTKIHMIRRVVKSYPMRAEQYKRLRVDTSFIRGSMYEDDIEDMRVENIPIEFKTIRTRAKERATRHTINAIYQLPYYGRLDPSLTIGRCLKIEGRARILPHSFSINLQHGCYTWPRPNVAFHFSPRYLDKIENSTYQQILICNSFLNGKWSNEVRFDIYKAFQPGRTFSLTIVCAKRCYEVYVNRRWLMDFKHRVHPSTVDMLYIEGDIKIWDVVSETKEWANIKRKVFRHPDFAASSREPNKKHSKMLTPK